MTPRRRVERLSLKPSSWLVYGGAFYSANFFLGPYGYSVRDTSGVYYFVFCWLMLFAATAFAEMNSSLPGEIAGPHLWPHGFDIATEWYSPKMAPFGESEASAQIAVGFYPSNQSYFYANPWPFEEDWASHPLPPGASWHRDGWQGAELPPAGLDQANIVAFGLSVHSIAGRALSS